MRDEFIARYVRPKAGRALVVGSLLHPGVPDDRARFAEAVGLDMQAGDGVDLVHDLENPLPKSAGRFAHVMCCSVLEHCRRPWLMAQNIEAALVRGGTLYVSVPFVWKHHGYPSDYWRFTHEGVAALFPRIAWETVLFEFDAAFHLPPKVTAAAEKVMPRTEVHAFGRKL